MNYCGTEKLCKDKKNSLNNCQRKMLYDKECGNVKLK
jgi:hypothetical protein